MPRILGVDVPGDKRVEFSLRYVYGIGPTRAQQVVAEAEIPTELRAKDLTDQQINRIIGVIQRNRFLIEGDLRRDIQQNLKRLQSINCYRGIRHRKGLPVRCQLAMYKQNRYGHGAMHMSYHHCQIRSLR